MKIWTSLAALAAFASSTMAADVAVGDTICVEGYVMDQYCIENVVLLDNPSAKTLQNPDLHTVHCLVDVGVCRKSDFEILTTPPAGSDEYVRSWRATQGTKSILIDEARKVGDPDNWCSTCEKGGLEQAGFRVTIKATVTSLADGDIPPIISVLEAFTSRTTDPDTLESTMIADNTCQYYFQMGDSSESAVVEATPPPPPTPQPTDALPPPTDAPTMMPVPLKTDAPTMMPVPLPTDTPTMLRQTASPTEVVMASDMPSDLPSDMPSDMPSQAPSASPIMSPTRLSVVSPTDAPVEETGTQALEDSTEMATDAIMETTELNVGSSSATAIRSTIALVAATIVTAYI